MNGSLAIVLTRDRPRILSRLVSMLAAHHPGMPVMVVDDSSTAAAVRDNGHVLRRAPSLGAAYHLTRRASAALGRKIDDAAGRRGVLDPLVARAGPRDISGMRNLAIVASSALRPGITFCIDDDVVPCAPGSGLPCFLDAVESGHRGSRNAVVGARMCGIADDSYSGRLCLLCEGGPRDLLAHEKGIRSTATLWRSGKNPLWREPAARRPRARRALHVSGGMMAIMVEPRRTVPFPAGYNEDWNWCLIQALLKGTDVLEDGRPSYHSPPALRRPGVDGIVWETLGDIMCYALRRAIATGRRFTLRSLGRHVSGRISGGYARGEITHTLGMLGRLAAGRGAAAARAAGHASELSAAAALLDRMDLGAFAKRWFEMQARRTALLSLVLGPSGPQDVIRGFVGGQMA